MPFFKKTIRPDLELFFKKNDENDRRLGEAVLYREKEYAEAKVVLLGCPQDEGVRRNGGRIGAKLAPTEIRRAFYKLPLYEKVSLFDAGDTLIQKTLEKTHDTHTEIVDEILRDGKILVVLGGGNDISYPDCKGLQKNFKDILAFNIDAHFDVRADEPANSGTPYRQLLEEKILSPKNFFEIASQRHSNSIVYEKYLRKKGVQIKRLDALREKGVEKTLLKLLEEKADALFWGMDMDAVRSADAPGVSAPSPVGLTAEEAIQIATLAGEDKRSRLFEITEVNPLFDIDAHTAKLAALLMWHFLRSASAQD
jgi:formiminoglutamase